MDLKTKYLEWESKCNELILKNSSFEKIKELYLTVFNDLEIKPVYWPNQTQIDNSNIGKAIKELRLSSYQHFHKWSISNREEFWRYAIDKLNLNFNKQPESILGNLENWSDPNWCEGGKLNISNSIFSSPKDKVAIFQGNESHDEVIQITYGQLDELSSQVANGLVNQGFKPGDRCAIFMPFNYESVAIYLGIVKAGMAVVSIADSFSSEELISRMGIVDTKLLFTTDYYFYGGKKIEVLPKTEGVTIPKVICQNNPNDSIEHDLNFNDFLGDKVFESVVVDPYHTSNILFSSGTTKAPKAIPWTHLTPIKCAVDGYFHQDIRSSDVLTWTTGMGWMMAPWLIYAGLINGATIALWTGSMSSSGYVDFIENNKVTVLGTIPSLARSWRKSKVLENRRLSVRLFSSTGEPSNEEDYLYLMYLQKFKAPIIEYCGGTEIGGGYITGTVVQPCAPSVFTTPALGLDFVLIDDKLNQSDSGEIFIIPPSIGLSEKLLNKDHDNEYFNHNVKNDGKYLRKHGDSYVRYPDYDGINTYFKCKGRVDDSMNLGGIKVSAVELEETIITNSDLDEVAAVGFSVAGGPENLYIFTTSEVNLNSRGDLNLILAQKLNPLFRIFEIIEVEKLPKTASNKLIRRQLKEYLLNR